MAPLQPQSSHVGLLLPVCSSAATVGLALYQYPQMFSFLRATPSIAGKPLSLYFEPLIKTAYPLIIANALTSTISGLLNARSLSTHRTLETSDVGKWYTYGAALAGAHLLFVPAIYGPVSRMISLGKEDGGVKSEEEIDTANRQNLKNWLIVHTARTLLVDLPALWCFAEGASLASWVSNV